MAPDIAVFEEHGSNGFAQNLNVLTDTSGSDSTTLDQYESGAALELKRTGAQDVTVNSRTSIDGEPAIHVSSMVSLNLRQYRVESYAAKHDGRWWVITLSFRPDVSVEQRSALASSIFATWKWDDTGTVSS